jgi:hypothetical protein
LANSAGSHLIAPAALQLLRPALRRYLARRSELAWTDAPGTTLILPAGLRDAVAASARTGLPQWAQGEVRANCHVATALGDDLLVVYRVAADARDRGRRI